MDSNHRFHVVRGASCRVTGTVTRATEVLSNEASFTRDRGFESRSLQQWVRELRSLSPSDFDEVSKRWRRGGAHCARCGRRATAGTLSSADVEPVVMA